MSLGVWLFLGIYFVAGGLIWYLYRRSKKNANKKRNDLANDTGTVDAADAGSEKILFTGLMLSDTDTDADSSDNQGSDGFDGGGFDGGDGGGFDGGGFDGGGFDGGGFDI